jgi:ribosomal protein S6E (S10)
VGLPEVPRIQKIRFAHDDKTTSMHERIQRNEKARRFLQKPPGYTKSQGG